MSTYEFTGKSVREAVAKACEELNVDEALLLVEVLEESAKGFLGIVGQRDARVRVRKRDIIKEVMQAEPAPAEPKSALPSPAATEGQVEAPPAIEEEYYPEEEQEEPSANQPDLSLFLDEARTVMAEILQRMDMDVQVEASIAEAAIYLDIKGDSSGLLIGKKGQTLDALQYVVNKIVNKHRPPGGKIDVIVDTENYRLRKRENLREMALKVSQKAKRTLRPVSLNPMPAHERRVIHLILADDREVYTKSYGEGQLRRIIVYPRRASAGKRRRR